LSARRFFRKSFSHGGSAEWRFDPRNGWITFTGRGFTAFSVLKANPANQAPRDRLYHILANFFAEKPNGPLPASSPGTEKPAGHGSICLFSAQNLLWHESSRAAIVPRARGSEKRLASAAEHLHRHLCDTCQSHPERYSSDSFALE
jgi:hypothetical protein